METKETRETNPLEELSNGDRERVETTVDAYLEETDGLSEVADGMIDDILVRLREKGPDLDPSVIISLRNAVQFYLGEKWKEKYPAKEKE